MSNRDGVKDKECEKKIFEREWVTRENGILTRSSCFVGLFLAAYYCIKETVQTDGCNNTG